MRQAREAAIASEGYPRVQEARMKQDIQKAWQAASEYKPQSIGKGPKARAQQRARIKRKIQASREARHASGFQRHVRGTAGRPSGGGMIGRDIGLRYKIR